MQDDWNGLLGQTAGNTYFLRWEWLWVWWNVYREEHDTLCIVRCYRGDILTGIAPFYVRRTYWNGVIPLRRLMFLGTHERGLTSEYLDIICLPDDEKAFAEKIIDMIAGGNICDDGAFHTVSGASPLVALMKKRASESGLLYRMEERYACPYIRLPQEYASFASSLSRSMHAKINRNYRRLEAHAKVRFRRTGCVDELQQDFQEFVKLHQTRWESQGLPGSFSNPRFLRFQQGIMQEMFRNGHLDFVFFEAGERTIAALYNIRYNKKIYFYQSAVDTSFDKRLAPGLLLHDHCIREAIDAGLQEYDFMMMGTRDGYKLRWTKNCRYICNVYIAQSPHLKLIKRVEDRARIYYRGIKSLYRRPLNHAH